jgi:hypothetical protein
MDGLRDGPSTVLAAARLATRRSRMLRWAEFEEAASELATLGRERFERFGFLFVGTVRKDGGPRVNPAEAHIVDGHLALCLIPRSLKALDLLRDPRAFLHTPVTDRFLGRPGEFKLRATAVEIRDGALRKKVADTLERDSGWRPPDGWHYLTMDVEGAAFLRYDEVAETHQLVRWTPAAGVEVSTRTYL